MLEIFVNKQKLDLSENISIPITYSIADVKNPDKREATHSKTIEIPGTKINNKVFSSIFDLTKYSIAGGSDFNPNLKVDCLILDEGLEILRGSLRLIDITYLENGSISYNCVAFGQFSNLFFSVGNSKINELDFSTTYDHDYTKTNIVNSWSATIGQGYVYPMIDYGVKNDSIFDVNDFRPAIYAKSIVDKIFSTAGFTYTSSFFTSDFFKRLIVPNNFQDLKLSDDEVLARSINNSYSSGTINHTLIAQDGTNKNIALLTPYLSSNYFIAPKSGYYDFKYLFQLQGYTITSYPTGLTSSNLSNIQIIAKLQLRNTITGNLSSKQEVYFHNQATSTTESTEFNFTLFIEEGEEIDYDVQFSELITFNTTLGSDKDGTVSLSFSETSTVTAQKTIQEGNEIKFNALLPENILCKDFLGSIIKMFNLYISQDKNNPLNLLIETRDTYYANETGILDWTKKVNRDTPFKITPLGELNFKTLKLSYKEDSDYYNKKYKDSWNQVYGTKLKTVTNDFVTNEVTIDNIFSATPCDGTELSNRIIPRFIKYNEKNEKQGMATNIRLLYYSGLKTCSPNWSFTANLEADTSFTSYPYCGMLDDPYAPTLDLAFDNVKELYWIIKKVNYTTNNLFNKYYSKFINEITDIDSKVVEMEIYLTAFDIYGINFAKKIYIDENYYFLNKIIDCDRVNGNLTKVELIKIKEGVVFVPTLVNLDSNFNNLDTERLTGNRDSVIDATFADSWVVLGGRNLKPNSNTTYIKGV